MLVEVGKFTFPADFVILEMEEDSKVPLILGRHFLHTADVVIRVKQKQLNLGVRTERMIFNIDSAMKHSYSNDDTCFIIDVIDEILEEDFDALLNEGSEIFHPIEGTILEEKLIAEFDEFMAMTADENSESESDTEEPPFEKITFNIDYKIKTSLEEPSTNLELKPLPDNLEYVFMEEPSFIPVSEAGLEVDKAKIDVISKLPLPTNIKGIRSFLGHAGFYQRFIKDYSKIARPLTKLLEKDTPFEFNDECHNAFKLLKEKLTCAPVIISPNWNLLFELMCDASDFAVGAILVLSKTIVHIDHSALRHLFKKQDAKPRLIHWILLLQEFDIEIKDRKGTENVAAYHLSRIENDETSDDSEVDDNFPGETLMEIDTRDEPWFTDFASYLVSDITPKGMTYQQKKKFFSDLKHYFWEEPYLFKVCSDGFYWTTIIKEAHTQVRLYEACQKTGNISKRDEMPLNSIQITVLTTNTPYPSRKIRRICACTHQRPRRPQDPIRRIQKDQYAVFKLYGNKIFWKISNVVPTLRNPQYTVSKTLNTPMDDPNITMEEYIRLEEEKARKRGKVFNWDTAKILFDDSDDEDYTVVFDKNSFSYKIISTNDLKTDLENDNEKVNMPLFPSPEPTVNCIDDLDFFKDFENEFPAIVYNDALTTIQHLMAEGLSARILMEHRDAQGQSVFTSRAWRFGEAILDLDMPGALQFHLGGVRRHMSWRESLFWLWDYIQQRRCRQLGAMISGGQYVAGLAEHFGLLTEERLQGLTVISPALPIINMAELVRLQLCIELGDTWAWVPTGPARQEGCAGGVAEEAPVAPEGGDGDEEIPQAVPPPPRTQGERIDRLEEEVHGVREALQGQREVMDSMARDFSRFSTLTVTSLARMMDRAGVPYTRYSESPVEYERLTKRRTDEPSTSTAPQQLDP
ncbi:reverse transcriptase domain-containing protein [Tanacetum coccineum]